MTDCGRIVAAAGLRIAAVISETNVVNSLSVSLFVVLAVEFVYGQLASG